MPILYDTIILGSRFFEYYTVVLDKSRGRIGLFKTGRQNVGEEARVSYANNRISAAFVPIALVVMVVVLLICISTFHQCKSRSTSAILIGNSENIY